MELGKHVEGANRGAYSDRISSLPDEILVHILSVLPTKRAVSTSILSTRWKYLFTLTNCLSFDDGPCWDDPVVENPIEAEGPREIRFKKFVNNVLELHQVSPIEKFSLVCRYTHDDSDWNAWISNAVKKGVRDLHCQVDVQHDVLPADLFVSQTLVRFKMTGFVNKYDLKIPLSAWLPSLKVLYLARITFFSHLSMERLFTACEMLDELTLNDCDWDCYGHHQIVMSNALLKILRFLTIENCSFKEGLFEIDAPNLARLSFINNTGVKIVPSWEDSCSLAKAELCFCAGEEDIVLVKAAADKVTELHLGANSLKLLLTLTGRKEMPDFHSLSSLHLCGCPFNEWKIVTSLFEKSPKLETVTFRECFYGRGIGGESGDTNVSPPNEELIPFSCHAKVIRVHEFIGGECSLLYLGHLLRNAGNLKRLSLHRHFRFSTASPQQILQINTDFDMLRSLPRASKDCCIELEDCIYSY